jgi:hypothetical protein
MLIMVTAKDVETTIFWGSIALASQSKVDRSFVSQLMNIHRHFYSIFSLNEINLTMGAGWRRFSEQVRSRNTQSVCVCVCLEANGSPSIDQVGGSPTKGTVAAESR